MKDAKLKGSQKAAAEKTTEKKETKVSNTKNMAIPEGKVQVRNWTNVANYASYSVAKNLAKKLEGKVRARSNGTYDVKSPDGWKLEPAPHKISGSARKAFKNNKENRGLDTDGNAKDAVLREYATPAEK